MALDSREQQSVSQRKVRSSRLRAATGRFPVGCGTVSSGSIRLGWFEGRVKCLGNAIKVSVEYKCVRRLPEPETRLADEKPNVRLREQNWFDPNACDVKAGGFASPSGTLALSSAFSIIHQSACQRECFHPARRPAGRSESTSVLRHMKQVQRRRRRRAAAPSHTHGRVNRYVCVNTRRACCSLTVPHRDGM